MVEGENFQSFPSLYAWSVMIFSTPPKNYCSANNLRLGILTLRLVSLCQRRGRIGYTSMVTKYISCGRHPWWCSCSLLQTTKVHVASCPNGHARGKMAWKLRPKQIQSVKKQRETRFNNKSTRFSPRSHALGDSRVWKFGMKQVNQGQISIVKS